MQDSAYDFPPTIWQVPGWSFSTVTYIMLVIAGVMLALIVLRKKVTGYDLFVWPVVALLLLSAWLQLPDITHDLIRPIVAVDYALNNVLLLLSLFGLCITIRRHVKLTGQFEFPTAFVVMADALLIFFGLLFPSVSTPRFASRYQQCKNSMKNIGLAMHNYHDVNGAFPARVTGAENTSWRIALLPWLEERELHEQYRADQAWDSPENIELASNRVSVYDCPQRPKGREWNSSRQFLTAYLAPTGPGTIYSGSDASTVRSITDGTSNTLLIVEACGTNVVWSEPADLNVLSASVSVNQGMQNFDQSDSVLSSYHYYGANARLADGSVRRITDNIDTIVLQALLSKDANDALPVDW